jgi:phosphoglycolate phosphatase
MAMKYLVLFDIDGTLINFKKSMSREIFAKMVKEIFQHEIPPTNLPNFAGMTDLKILKEIAVKIKINYSEIEINLPKVWEKILEEFKHYCDPEYMILLPGIPELLNSLACEPDIVIGLQTGNFKQNAYRKLKVFGLEKYFAFGAFGSDHEDRKQLPLIAIARANKHIKQNIFSNKNTLVIGDSIRDIDCAKSNNLPVLAVATGNTDKEELIKYEPDGILDNMSDKDLSIKLIFELLQIKNGKNKNCN